MRIRQNLTQGDLAGRFCIDQSSVSLIPNQWIPMLANVLGGLIVWPQTNIGPATPSYDFLPNSVSIMMALKFLFSVQFDHPKIIVIVIVRATIP